MEHSLARGSFCPKLTVPLVVVFVSGLIWAALPMEPAEAACRPITIGDLPPLPPDQLPPQPPPPPPPPEPPPPGEPPPPPVEGEEPPAEVAPAPEPPAEVAPPPPIPPPRSCFVYRMQWPVLGGETGSSFGAPRDGGARRHLGVDIFAPKLTPVVAVANGVVTEVNGPGPQCCWVKIRHDDGWSTVYVHLNNDTFETDDGRGNGVRPGLEVGRAVLAGEVIGWLGDSGNAETASPHLHFELRMRNGTPIDPLPSLRWAQRNAPMPALEGASRQYGIAYVDDDGLPAELIFNLLTSVGGFTPCDSWGARACPHDLATPDDAAAWITAFSGIEVLVRPPPTDLTVSEENAALTAALLCLNNQCPPPTITVGEAAKMISWAWQWKVYQPEGGMLPPPSDYKVTEVSAAWNHLVSSHLATDCAALPVALDTVLTRAALAEVLGQAFGQLPVLSCSAAVS